MERRTLGRTGLSVTALGFGAMELRRLGDHEAAHLLNAVLDGGINYIDTAPDYGPSEALIGKAIAHRRSDFYLASKCGCDVDDAGQSKVPPHIWTGQKLLENVENSLRLLKTDHLDVWQLHGVVPAELAGGQHDPVIETMMQLKRQGKARSIGVSFKNGGPADPLFPSGYAFAYAREFLTWGVFDVMQIVYSGLTRRSESVIAKAAQQGVGVVVRGVVKKYRDTYDDQFAAAKLSELCAAGESSSDFLIRFALSHTGMSTMIIGTKSTEHLAANIAAASKGKLPDSVYAEARKRLAAIGIAPEA